MKKVLAILTAGIFVLSAGNYACAKDPHFQGFSKEKKEQFKQRRQELREQLNLSEEQREKAKQIHMQARPEIEPIVQQIRQKAEELREMKQSGATPEEMKAKVEEIKALRQQANSIREQNLQNFESILNPEQKAIFGDFKGEMKQKREDFRHNRKQRFLEKREQRRNIHHTE